MYLRSSSWCVSVTPITNCSSYSQVASTTTCIACTANYYVSNNLCSARVNSLNIPSCAQTASNADQCYSCKTGYSLTSDGRLCLASIASCVLYSSSTYQTTAQSCSFCADGYYLSTLNGITTCTAGSVVNCKIYQSSADTCQECANGYYLEADLCVQHVTITNCSIYDQTTKNTCTTCKTGFYPFALQNVCQTVDVITNCKEYNAAGNRCSTCNTGYYLTTTYTCLLIAPSLNCISMSSAAVCL
jgi:hypothetical protein